GKSKMQPLTVIIPSYNRASQLDATLASLTRQSRSDFQVVLVNHGSTDQTAEVARKYANALHLAYYEIARDGIHFDNVPRDFGVRQAEAPLLLFLDTGMIMPSWFIDAHLTFHRLHPGHVGIGLQHGYQGMESFQQDDATAHTTEEQTVSLLEGIDIDHAYEVIKREQLQDQREGIDLATSPIPWFFGWSANLSMSRAAYDAAGGFDLELEGWGFKDVDLCYRLSRSGQTLAFVENGWGIELPQPRTPMLSRLQSHQLNQLRCYTKQRSVALEALLLAQLQLREAITSYYERPATTENQENVPLSTILDLLRTQIAQYSAEMVRYMTGLKRSQPAQLRLPADIQAQIARPSLLIGGTPQDASDYDYVAVGDEQVTSTSSLWSCWGLRNPLPDHSLATVVVSDIWTHLNWSLSLPFGLPGTLLLENLVTEIKRTAQKAVFIYPSEAPAEQDGLLSILEQTCQKHQLAFQLLRPQPVC
ncbi:MAG TPA: glycosyltransferase family 2 protein, partial [Ktedonobacteraceae bacterium]|nr:glycosyltransferase family 2 protein [Ktedonobacteraceae bacterium]